MRIGIIVNSLMQMGPVNVAIAEYRALKSRGFDVQLFYVRDLKVEPELRDLGFEKISFQKLIKCNVVHSHSFRPDVINCTLKLYNRLQGNSALHLSTCHNNLDEDLIPQYGFLLGKLISIIWIIIFTLLDKVFVLSNYTKVHKLRRLTEEKKITLYNFVEKPIVRATSNHNSELIEKINQTEGKRYIMCNVLEKRKNVDAVVNHFDAEGTIFIFGDGSERQYIESLVSEKKIQDKILLFGHIPDAQKYFHLFDGLILASSSEGFPLVVLEAMLSSVPCLVSDLPIYDELFGSELTRFDVNSKESFLAGLERISLEKEKLINEAYEKVVKTYNLDAHMDVLLNTYIK